jgi:hypothetical protein
MLSVTRSVNEAEKFSKFVMLLSILENGEELAKKRGKTVLSKSVDLGALARTGNGDRPNRDQNVTQSSIPSVPPLSIHNSPSW